MSTNASSNGRGSHAWCRPWEHIRADRRSPGYCRVTFDHPPVNAITVTTVHELAELVELIEEDADLGVVVFDSANPDVYLAGDEVEADGTAARLWMDVLARLSRAPVVSIASIRGRVRGAGRELVLACDLRFVSRENALVVGDLGGPRGRRDGILSRVIADDELDDEVEDFASRLARLDHEAIERTKSDARAALPGA
jgi:enoyl-CoA hydratase/carnithine racemase